MKPGKRFAAVSHGIYCKTERVCGWARRARPAARMRAFSAGGTSGTAASRRTAVSRSRRSRAARHSGQWARWCVSFCRLTGGEFAIHVGAQPRLDFFAGHSVQILKEINESYSKTPARIAKGALQQSADGFAASGEEPFGGLFGNLERFSDFTIAVVFIVS